MDSTRETLTTAQQGTEASEAAYDTRHTPLLSGKPVDSVDQRQRWIRLPDLEIWELNGALAAEAVGSAARGGI